MKKIILILTLALFSMSSALLAQSLNSAGKAFDKGNELVAEGNVSEAIESYQKCAYMSAELGELGECIKVKSELKICKLYMDAGIEKFNEKNYDVALEKFDSASEYAKLIQDDAIISKLTNYKAASYTGKANLLFKSTKYKKAVEMYLQALEYNHEYSNAYYGLVLSYSKLDEGVKLEEAEEMVQQYSSDDKLKNKARIAAGKFYLNKTHKAIQKEEYNIASMMAIKSMKYSNQDPLTHYYRALASNEREDWPTAEKSALKAISLGGEDVSDYYFELGRAYEGSGKIEKACEAYSKVTSGQNKTKGGYRLFELDCN